MCAQHSFCQLGSCLRPRVDIKLVFHKENTGCPQFIPYASSMTVCTSKFSIKTFNSRLLYLLSHFMNEELRITIQNNFVAPNFEHAHILTKHLDQVRVQRSFGHDENE